MNERTMARTLAILLLFAAQAAAAEALILVLKDGDKRTVEPVSFDDTGLLAKYGAEQKRFPWSDLAPGSAYAARKALTPYDDGARILELSRFARGLKLYPEAHEQLEVALALGGLDEAAFEKERNEVAAEEVEFLTATIDSLLETDAEPERCLAAIKRLRERYPTDEANARYEPHVKELVQVLAEGKQAEEDAATKKADDKALAKLREAVGKEQAKKEESLATAAELIKEADPAIELRQVSRVKKRLVEPQGAEKHLKDARKRLRNIAKLDPQGFLVTRDELQKEYAAIEKLLVDCYVKVARILMKERAYKSAVEYVRKILFYDPIHEEALEMVEEIRKNRITFKVSELTNARPRVTGG
jgi:tetratricopeptide (TPR) repeat protein